MSNSTIQVFTLILFISILTSSCNSFNKRKAVGKWTWEIKAERDFSDPVRIDTVEFTMDGIFNVNNLTDQIWWDIKGNFVYFTEITPSPRTDSFQIIPSNRFDRFYIKYESDFTNIRLGGKKIYRNLWGI